MWHPDQIPEPPQLTPFNVENQQLYFEQSPDDTASYPISKGKAESSQPPEEAHSGICIRDLVLSTITHKLSSFFTTTDWSGASITVDGPPISPSITSSIPPSLMNKTPTPLLEVETEAQPIGGSTPFPLKIMASDSRSTLHTSPRLRLEKLNVSLFYGYSISKV